MVRESPLLPTSRPYWHRPDPLTSVVHLDPGHADLRRLFPTSWRHLLRVKSLLDCTAHLDVPDAFDQVELQTWVQRLLEQVARELEGFSAAEEAAGAPRTAAQGRDLAATVAAYASTGAWPDYTVHSPEGEDAWLYCGPLATWAERAARMPLTLLVCAAEPELQRVVDGVTGALPAIGETVGRALGRPVALKTETPGMYPTRLLLAGGESALGHKNFAHFMPLETPNGTVAGPAFTVIFANVHRERLVRCSMPLLRGALESHSSWDPQAVLEASLVWFRCHDLGHFWRAGDHVERSPLAETLSHFERMTLEEACADSLGVVCAAELWDPEDLAVAFYAELMRYLSRNPDSFADSVAATLELGWLTQHGLSLSPIDAGTASKVADCLAELVPMLHDALWSATPPPGTEWLRQAVAGGRQELQRFGPLYSRIPTDVTYSFG